MSKPITIDGVLYRPIPGYLTTYAISRDGILHSFILGRRMVTFRTARGYQRVSLFLSSGVSVTRYIHRLILTAWAYPVGGDLRLLRARYINDVVGDDRLENLEWVPIVGASIRYGRQAGEERGVEVRDVNTGRVTGYANAYDAAIAHGFHPTTATWRCRYPQDRVWPDDTQWRYVCDDPWPLTTPEETAAFKRHHMNKRPVEVFDVFTGKVTWYPSLAVTARCRDTTSNALYRRIAREGSPTFPEGYQIRYEDEPWPWHICDDYWLHIEDCMRNHKLFVAVNEVTKQAVLSFTGAALARELGVSYKPMLQRIARSQERSETTIKGNWFNGYQIFYYRDWCRVCSLSDYRVNVV